MTTPSSTATAMRPLVESQASVWRRRKHAGERRDAVTRDRGLLETLLLRERVHPSLERLEQEARILGESPAHRLDDGGVVVLARCGRWHGQHATPSCAGAHGASHDDRLRTAGAHGAASQRRRGLDRLAHGVRGARVDANGPR